MAEPKTIVFEEKYKPANYKSKYVYKELTLKPALLATDVSVIQMIKRKHS
jgi:hypothetical protein